MKRIHLQFNGGATMRSSPVSGPEFVEAVEDHQRDDEAPEDHCRNEEPASPLEAHART